MDRQTFPSTPNPASPPQQHTVGATTDGAVAPDLLRRTPPGGVISDGARLWVAAPDLAVTELRARVASLLADEFSPYSIFGRGSITTSRVLQKSRTLCLFAAIPSIRGFEENRAWYH